MHIAALECEWGHWSSWSKCTKSCGGGTTTTQRKKISGGANGGFCSGSDFKSKSCNTQHCNSTPDCPNWPYCNTGI